MPAGLSCTGQGYDWKGHLAAYREGGEGLPTGCLLSKAFNTKFSWSLNPASEVNAKILSPYFSFFKQNIIGL